MPYRLADIQPVINSCFYIEANSVARAKSNRIQWTPRAYHHNRYTVFNVQYMHTYTFTLNICQFYWIHNWMFYLPAIKPGSAWFYWSCHSLTFIVNIWLWNCFAFHVQFWSHDAMHTMPFPCHAMPCYCICHSISGPVWCGAVWFIGDKMTNALSAEVKTSTTIIKTSQ